MAHGHDHHGHGHGGHHHHPAPGGHDRAFAWGIGLNLAYIALEAGYGLAAGSLALVADAGHNLSDVLGLALAWGAVWLGRRRPTAHRTYGFRRSSIMASLANAVLLLVAVGAIGIEAVRRLLAPEPVAAGTVVWVALAGVLVNGVTAWLFMAGRERDINIKGAFLHMAADTLVTVGVIVAALLIGWTGWAWLDPFVSLAIAAVILAGSWGLLRRSVDLALDAVPAGIDPHAVEACLAGQPGVAAVHDLHIWAMSTTETALTAHLVCPDPAWADLLIRRVRDELQARFGIAHTTLQIEAGNPAHPCPQAAEHAV